MEDDDLYYAVKGTLAEYGISGTSNDGPHTWRCEYPERYGACTCIDDLTKDIVSALNDIR
jgi:hypothetical protein